MDKETEKVNETFECKSCNAELKKNECENEKTLFHDYNLNESISINKQVPVLINYFVEKKRYKKVLDKDDFELIDRIEEINIPYWYPHNRMCIGSESRRNDKSGFTHVHHFYTKRNLYIASLFLDKCSKNDRIDHMLRCTLQSCLFHISKFNRKVPGGIGRHLSGTLYLPSLSCEVSFFSMIERKINDFVESVLSLDLTDDKCIITQNSLTNMHNIPPNCIDYIFTDPPFGDNLSYSELSFIWEAWLNSFTNNRTEAIVNKSHGKNLIDYQNMMTDCFKEYYRVLKPNRWMTVEFHNSKNVVWNSIQASLQHSGFIIADVRTLDKQQGSFKQVNSTNAVKQDLVISAYKPKDNFIREFADNAGSVETIWSFIRQHLENIPVVVFKNQKIETVAERQAFLLFDRMVAYHIIHGISVPLDAIDFYKGLDERYLKRDGMYFLPDQVNEYDVARITNDVEPIQFELFVTNEKSAIAWLYQQLDNPQIYAELQPKFMQEIKAWDKFEERPELSTLLEENFLQNDEGKWYVPDVTKAADVIKLREKKLLKEFESYLTSKGKLKLFRAEAVRVGFAKLWTDNNYKLIVETADRLPESVIQEDDKLLMYYDISLGRI